MEKLKGVSYVRFPNGKTHKAEIHWYEAHGVGRRKMKIKHILGTGRLPVMKAKICKCFAHNQVEHGAYNPLRQFVCLA